MSRRGFRIPKFKMPEGRLRDSRLGRSTMRAMRRVMPNRRRSGKGPFKSLVYPLLVVVGLLIVGMGGIAAYKSVFGTSNIAEGEREADSDQNPLMTVSEPILDRRVVGQWKGRAGLDESLLQAKMHRLPISQRAQLQHLSDNHLSTRLVADFQADGTLRFEMTSGKGIAPQSHVVAHGKWATRFTEENRVVLSLEFVREGDTEIRTTELDLHFIGGHRHAAMVAPTGPELSDCQPIYLFERIEQVGLASKPDETTRK